MRACLIIPPASFLQDDWVFPPLGVLRVGAVLEEAGHEVVVVHGSDEIPSADVYGITATTPQMPAAMEERQGRTILGGAHATLVAASARRGSFRGVLALADLLANFSCVVAGDGELAIHDALAGGTGLLDADVEHSKYYVQNQDHLPLPARHLIDLDSYKYLIDGKRSTSMITQLGCPFGCGFCGGRYSRFYRRVRRRSIGAILREVEHLIDLGYEGIMFLDDELNIALDLVLLMERLENYHLALRGFARASLFTEQQANSMVKAGFKEILFGFESGSDRMLTNMQKGSVEDNTRAFQVAREAGLRVKALMSIGHPGESEETVKETAEWLVEQAPDEFDLTIVTPYPGSPYWDDADYTSEEWIYTAPSGDKLHQVDSDYLQEAVWYKGVPGKYFSHVYTDHLTPADLVYLRDSTDTAVREVLYP